MMPQTPSALDQPQVSDEAVGAIAHLDEFEGFEIAGRDHRYRMHRGPIPSIPGTSPDQQNFGAGGPRESSSIGHAGWCAAAMRSMSKWQVHRHETLKSRRIGLVRLSLEENVMTKVFGLAIGALVIGISGANAQSAEPSYKASPDVYKVIFEDANFRVISVNRPKGLHDKAHSHPLPGIIYNVTDCSTKLYEPDGKTRDNNAKAGTASASPITQSHSAENTGNADCKQLLVENK